MTTHLSLPAIVHTIGGVWRCLGTAVGRGAEPLGVGFAELVEMAEAELTPRTTARDTARRAMARAGRRR